MPGLHSRSPRIISAAWKCSHAQADNRSSSRILALGAQRLRRALATSAVTAARRLAAILAADVVGYSRLMGEDEAGTVKLARERREAATPTARAFGGRLVKTMGDGVLLEFPSVVAAVECAIAIQKMMAERNAVVPEAKRILYRVGVNLGDILIEGDDILGDGVNVASRLEGVCEPGAICLSASAHDQVRGRIEAEFADLGERELKNIAKPVRAYGLTPLAIAGAKAEVPPVPPSLEGAALPAATTKTRLLQRWPKLAAALALALLAAGGYAWRAGYAPRFMATSVDDRLANAPRLSIVVLPFENMSSDPEQDYFADGITDDLTTDLSHLADSFVISRGTAFTYKGKPIDAKQIGRELGVRYLLEGSVRRLGENVEVNAQLISTETGAHVWADRFEGERSKLGELQVETVSRLSHSLGVELVRAEALRATRERPNNPDAVDLAMQGRAVLNRQYTKANVDEAKGYFERALQLDPQLFMALLGLARVYTDRSNASRGADRADNIERAEALVARVLSVEPNNATAHWINGALLLAKKQLSAAIAEQNAIIAIDSNFAWAHADLGYLQTLTGRAAEAFPELETALRLSPRDPSRNIWEFLICNAHAHLAQWDQVIEWCRKSIATVPSSHFAYAYLAAAYGWTGRDAEAHAAVAELLKLKPGFTLQSFVAFGRELSDDPTYLREHSGIAEGMRKAGVPEGEQKTN
jgi:adenylate cyclase